MALLADAEADISELRSLLSTAVRPRVQELLQREIRILEEGSAQAPQRPPDATGAAVGPSEAPPAVPAADALPNPSPAAGSAAPAAEPAAAAAAAAAALAPVIPAAAPVLLQKEKAPVHRAYSPLSSFSWDQDSDKVKVYFFLEGATKEGVELDVRPRSVDVRLHDVGSVGRHLRWGVPHLHRAVDPERSTVVVKPKRVTVTLRKKTPGHWVDIHHKEDALKPKVEANKDPMAGIMDMMKNMYEDGDEEMKKTIAKAWMDAQVGKTNSMPGSFGGF